VRGVTGESLPPALYPLYPVLVVGIALLCAALMTSMAEAMIFDRIVAVVNDDVITLTEVQEEGLQTIRKIVRESLGEERERLLRKTERQILDGLILRKLQLQEAKKEKIEASQAEVRSAIEDFKKRNGVTSDEQLQAVMAKEQLTEEQFKKGIAEQVALTKLVARQVRSKVAVLDEEVRRYYDEHREEFRDIPQVRIRHLLVAVPPQPAREDLLLAKGRIEEAQALIRMGAKFSTVAKRYSSGPLASSSGEVWTMKRGELAPELEQMALVLPIGDVSSIITNQAGFHLIQVEERVMGQIVPFDRIREDIRAHLGEQKAEAKFKEWVQGLKSKASVEMKM